MKVCIIRNAELESNASVQRIVDAMRFSNHEVLTLTRSREKENNKHTNFLSKGKDVFGESVNDTEIQIYSKRGSGLKNIFSLLKYQTLMFTWLKNNRDSYDALHSFDLDTGIVSLIISKLYNKKFIYHIADFFVDSRPRIPQILRNFIKKLEFSVINKSDLTIICTEYRIKQIEGSKPKKLIVVHNTPVTTDYLSDKNYKKEENDNKLVIGYVGGLSDKRFILELLELASENKNYILEIAGYGVIEEKVKEYSENHNNINFYGQINYNQTMDLYSKVDIIFAMYDPRIRNNQFSAPNKVYEAMYLGKPIIVAKGTGVDDLVKSENIGYVIDYNKEKLGKIFNYILNNKNDLNKKAQNGKMAYSKYSWMTMRERLLEAYSSL